MSGFEPSVRPATQSLNGKAAILVLAFTTALSGCAQTPVAPGDTAPRDSAAKTTAALNTSTCARPEYPQDARRRGSQGTTTVRFLIDIDGSVAQSHTVKSSGDASLDEAARSALDKCRFKPAMKEGKPHRAWVPVQYVWSMAPARPPQVSPVAQP